MENGKLILAALCFLVSFKASAVVNGRAATDGKFTAVGSLRIGSDEDVSCTATLINANWIVTADHCTHASDGSDEEGGGDPLAASEYEFRLGSDSRAPVLKVKLKRWVNDIKVNGEAVDMAFGELQSAVPIQKLQITPIPVVAQEWNSEDLLASYVHVGYGPQLPFGGSTPLDYKRQLANLTVTHVEGNALLKIFGSSQKLENYLMTHHPQSIEAGSLDAIIAGGELLAGYYVHAWDSRGRTNLNKITVPTPGWQDTCFGDSGGPLLREIEGELKVVGVVSQGMDRICSPFGTKFTILGPKLQKTLKSLGL